MTKDQRSKEIRFSKKISQSSCYAKIYCNKSYKNFNVIIQMKNNEYTFTYNENMENAIQ